MINLLAAAVAVQSRLYKLNAVPITFYNGRETVLIGMTMYIGESTQEMDVQFSFWQPFQIEIAHKTYVLNAICDVFAIHS